MSQTTVPGAPEPKAPLLVPVEPTEEGRAPVVAPEYFSYDTITGKIDGIVLGKTPLGWWFGFLLAGGVVFLLLVAITYLFAAGVGIWGINIPVAWAFAITNFVWWIGIGHAGTLISAILLLLTQNWRTSINRFAEAMTLFAVANAALFPVLHLGRPWFLYWLFPYPAPMGVWPQFRSPLVWDVFAVSTYGTISLLFWYMAVIPDAASVRDRATSRVKKVIFGLVSWGWRGSAKHWQNLETAYLIMAGLATPLVVSVHSVVSFDFAVSLLPGWHSTIFPPYFVAGAIFSGFAMVLTIAIPLRRLYHLEGLVTMRHIENMAKLMLASGMIVAYSYIIETLMVFYSGGEFEIHNQLDRMFGYYKWLYWGLIFCNVVLPQFLWFKRARTQLVLLFLISIGINVGMWLERFVIIVTSLHADFLPSSYGIFEPTVWDIATFVGTLGLFTALIFLFVRFVPMISAFEMRQLVTKITHREVEP